MEPVLIPFTLEMKRFPTPITIQAAVTYSACAQKVLFHLKFLGVTSLARCCAFYIATHCNPLPGAEYLVPIPVHKNRLANRGFNQAFEITQYLSLAWNIPILDCLERVDYASASSRKSRSERLKTSRSFRVITKRAPPRGSTLILIDDIVTTGVTLHTAATALQSLEPKKISAICFTASL